MIQGIQDSLTPKSRKKLQCLNRVIIHHLQYLPHLATIMAALADHIVENGLEWHPVHEEALAQIKRLASETPVLRPI
jgi:hypothetical protein